MHWLSETYTYTGGQLLVGVFIGSLLGNAVIGFAKGFAEGVRNARARR